MAVRRLTYINDGRNPFLALLRHRTSFLTDARGLLSLMQSVHRNAITRDPNDASGTGLCTERIATSRGRRQKPIAGAPRSLRRLVSGGVCIRQLHPVWGETLPIRYRTACRHIRSRNHFRQALAAYVSLPHVHAACTLVVVRLARAPDPLLQACFHCATQPLSVRHSGQRDVFVEQMLAHDRGVQQVQFTE